MIQSIRARLGQKSSSGRQDLSSSVPMPWPEITNYQTAGSLLSRTSTWDIEKGSSAPDISDMSECRPLVAVASASPKSHVPLYGPKTMKTGLAMFRRPQELKGPEALAAIRLSASENRDAIFAQSTEALLDKANSKKPAGYTQVTFSYRHCSLRSESDLLISKLSERLTILESIYQGIEPNQCRFNKPQAEAFASAVIAEFVLFCQTMPLSDPNCPRKIELFTNRIASFINAIACDIDTTQAIQEVFMSVVTEHVWHLATAAQAAGHTCDLERYLSLHAEWQNRFIASRAPRAAMVKTP